MANVLILGGGFGGLAAAHELRQLLGPEHQITVVAKDDQFFMGFAKLWDLGDVRPLAEGTRQLTGLEHKGIHFVHAPITDIDPERRSVSTDGGVVEGDAMIVALGTAQNPAHLALLDGAAAHDLYDAAELPAMRAAIDGVASGRVVVAILGAPFKCPPAPYEAALIVDERLRARGVRDDVAVTVVTPQPMTLPAAGPDASRYVADRLVDHAIELTSGRALTAVDHSTSTITLDDGSTLDFTLLLGVPSNVPLPVLKQSPLAAASGWIEPDRHSMRTQFDRVYAVGDCTLIPNAKGQLPKAGVFAAAEGLVAARNVVADLVGGEAASFDGHGYCFLELPGRKVAFVEGNFYAEPELDVHITDADDEHFQRKQAFERERLDAWLG